MADVCAVLNVLLVCAFFSCRVAESPSSVAAKLDIDEAELSRIDELLDSIFTPTPVELVKIVLYRRHRRRGILRSRETGNGNRTAGDDGGETGSRVDSVGTATQTNLITVL